MEGPCKSLMMEKSGTMRRGWHRGLVVPRGMGGGVATQSGGCWQDPAIAPHARVWGGLNLCYSSLFPPSQDSKGEKSKERSNT